MKLKGNVFSKAALAGIAVIAISLWMMVAGKVDIDGVWMPEGFKVPVLALEFASNQEEMSNIIESISKANNRRIVFGTQIDMLFLIAYNLFLFYMLSSIYKITKLNQYKVLMIFPIVIMLADVAENYQLFKALDGEAISVLALKLATWVKWLGLALVFTAIGRFLITTGRYFDKVLALSTFVTLPLGLWAMFSHNGINEVFAMLFYLLFPLTILFAWFPGVRKKMEIDN